MSTPCPHCGATDQWEVSYSVPESQSVSVIGKPGSLEVDEYLGCTRSYDSGPNETITCHNCWYEEVLGESEFKSLDVQKVNMPRHKGEVRYGADGYCVRCAAGGDGDDDGDA